MGRPMLACGHSRAQDRKKHITYQLYPVTFLCLSFLICEMAATVPASEEFEIIQVKSL